MARGSDPDFGARLFEAIGRFETEHGFAPRGILDAAQMDALRAAGGAFLDRAGFEVIRHPATGTRLWLPMGLPLTQTVIDSGYKYENPRYGVVITYDYFPDFRIKISFDALLGDLRAKGFKIFASTLFQDQYFIVSMSNGVTDGYVRYHKVEQDGVGFSLYWNHAATDAHFERIATLMSASLWAATGGAPFVYPFTTAKPDAAASPAPSASPAASQEGAAGPASDAASGSPAASPK